MENTKQNKKVFIVLGICIFLISILLVNKEMQNDTFFTIKIGNDVFENGMSRIDNLTIHENIKFIHLRWAFDAIIAFLYNIFNFNGIYIFTALFTGIIGVSFFYVMIKRNINVVIAFTFTLFAMIASCSCFAARAQIITYLLFILEVYLIEKVIRYNNKKDMFLLAVLPLFIANFHASVLPMYFVLFMPYIAESVIFKIENRISKKESKAFTAGKLEINNYTLKPLLIIMGIGFVLGLCSPAFIDGYTYMFKCILGASSNIINELQNISIKLDSLVWIMFVFFIILLLIKDTKVRLCDLFMILGLGFMAFLARRNIVFFYFIGSLSIANIIQSSKLIMDVINGLNMGKYTKKILFIVCVFTCIISMSLLLNRITEPYINTAKYPVSATEYIKQNVDINNMRIFNHLNFGSYLELNNIPVFIDSRTEIYCVEFNPNSLLIEWDLAKTGDESYDYLFEKYNITHVLVYNSELINKYIKKDKNYEQIYSDVYFTLYKRII